MGFSTRVRWVGRKVTRDVLGELVDRARAANIGGDSEVSVHVDSKFNNPSDPGGEITLSIEG